MSPLPRYALVVFAALALAYRASDALSHPTLHCEDGSVLLSRYFAGNAEKILTEYAGYRSILPQLFGYFACRLPAHALPSIFACTGFAIALASVFVVYRSLPNRRAGALACVAIACAPIANHALLTSVTYSMVLILLCLCLVTASFTPSRPAQSVATLIVCSGLALSHPLAVAATPVALRRMIGDAVNLHGRIFFASLALVCLACPLWSAALASDAALAFSASRATLTFFPYFFERVICEGLLGPDLRALVRDAGATWIFTALGALTTLLLAYACTRRRRQDGAPKAAQRFAQNLFVMAIAITLLALGAANRNLDCADTWAQRYCYVQRCLLFCAAAILLTTRMRPRPVFVATCAAISLAWLTSGHWLYKVDRAAARQISEYMTRLEEASRDDRLASYPQLDRPGWIITIQKRRR